MKSGGGAAEKCSHLSRSRASACSDRADSVTICQSGWAAAPTGSGGSSTITWALVPPTPSEFTAARRLKAAPALDFTPTYFHTEASVEADTRDVPGYPSSGGRYRNVNRSTGANSSPM